MLGRKERIRLKWGDTNGRVTGTADYVWLELYKTKTMHRPIFFIGVPRSGTTIIFEAFARHEALAWPSAYSSMNPRLPLLNALRPVLDNRFVRLGGRKKQHARVLPGNRFLPMPDEAYEFWDEYAGHNFSHSYLLGCLADDETKLKVTQAVKQIAMWQRKERFIAKLTGPARITFLRSIFPTAIFIHVIRDGKAVVKSLLGVDFWQRGGLESPWWNDGLPEGVLDRWRQEEKIPSVLAALQWRFIIESAREEADKLEAGAYREVSYSDFVDQPEETIRSLLNFAGLERSKAVDRYIQSMPKRTAPINRVNTFDDLEDKVLTEICSEVDLRIGGEGRSSQVDLRGARA